ncbi:hypothetical protein Efla_003103 [Eimeria flavescens]
MNGSQVRKDVQAKAFVHEAALIPHHPLGSLQTERLPQSSLLQPQKLSRAPSVQRIYGGWRNWEVSNAPWRGAQHHFPVLYGPSSATTCEDTSSRRDLGNLTIGRRASVGDWATLPAGWMYSSIRTKKKRGKREFVNKNAEQKETKASMPPLRLEDYASTAEPSAAIAATIRAETFRALKGRKTGRMFVFRNKYRLQRLMGLTHDVEGSDAEDRPSRKPQGRSFVTPLTRLQHQATLPRSPLHSRFNFRHSLRYTVEWGGPQVAPDVPSACSLTFRIGDLGLTAAQRTQLAAIVGRDRISGDLCCVESDVFPELNQNAAHLGDSLELLVREDKAVSLTLVAWKSLDTTPLRRVSHMRNKNFDTSSAVDNPGANVEPGA